jgi:hypothetical protein
MISTNDFADRLVAPRDRMTAPDLLHGAWMRRSVSIDGGPGFETQSVVWLQAGTRYADLRVPFHAAAGERCFAGRSGWDGDCYRWTHRLDLEGTDTAAADDTGDLTWEDGAVVERGIFPTPDGAVPYEEIWVRLPDADGPWQVLEAPHACLVRVGRHSITVVDRRAGGGRFAACYRVQRSGRWRIELAIGEATPVAALPAPGDVPRDWRLVHAGDSSVVRA